MASALNLNETELNMWSEFIETVLTEEPDLYQKVFTLSMYVIFVVSLIGNLLTCIVIYYDRSMHTATNYYLFNLAISDLVVSFAMLMDISGYGEYSFGNMTCKIHFCFVVALWNNGILIMTALAVERYIAICYPLMLTSKPVWRRVSKIIALIWMIAIFETLPELWTVGLIKTRKSSMCFTLPTPIAKAINGVLALITFILPLAIMMFVYTMIAFAVRVNQKNTLRDKIFNQRDNSSKVHRLIALTLSFLVCWLPFFTMRVTIFIYDVHQIMKFDKWWRVVYHITAFNSWFSAVLNPLLFSVMSTKFRKSLKSLWNSKIKRQSTERRVATV